MEIFAGSAGITAALRNAGLQCSFGIDSVLYKVRFGPVVRFDLLQPSNLDLIFSILSSKQVIFVWLAPPCGTASLARQVPLPGHRPGPQPLRSWEHPDGLPSLNEWDQDRVQKANTL